MEARKPLSDLTYYLALCQLVHLKISGAIMGPKQKGKSSQKQRPKKRVVEEDNSEEVEVVEVTQPTRRSRESRNKWDIDTKMSVINRITGGKILSRVSDEMCIPVGVVSQWWLQRDDIRNAYKREALTRSGEDIVEEHIRISQEAFDRKRMEKFLSLNPEVPVSWKPIKKPRLEDPLSDDSAEDPDEDYTSRREYIRKESKTSEVSVDDFTVNEYLKEQKNIRLSEEDAGSWSMSFVQESNIEDPIVLSSDESSSESEEESVPEYVIKKHCLLVKKHKNETASSEEDAGSWSMSFVGKSDKSPVKSKKVANTKIKDVLTVPKIKIKEIMPPLPKKRHLSTPKKLPISPLSKKMSPPGKIHNGLGSSSGMMDEIDKIKKDQKVMKKHDFFNKRKDDHIETPVRTSTYEVKTSPVSPPCASPRNYPSAVSTKVRTSPRPPSASPRHPSASPRHPSASPRQPNNGGHFSFPVL